MVKKARIVPCFQKGLRVWEHIACSSSGLRLTDLSKMMDLPPSNVTLYLNTLLSSDMVVRDSLTKKFFISPRAVNLFRNSSESLIHKLLDCVDEPMLALHRQFNENVLLAVQKENNLAFIKHISTSHTIRVEIQSTPDYCMHITAAGRAILAFLPEKEIERYVSKATFVRLTDKTVNSAEELRKALAETRRIGYALNPGEFEDSVMATAAPIVVEGRPIASLIVQFPTLRHSRKDAKEAAAPIMKQARIIEAELKKLV